MRVGVGDVLYFAVIIMFSAHMYSVSSFHSFEEKCNIMYKKLWKMACHIYFYFYVNVAQKYIINEAKHYTRDMLDTKT